MKVFQFTWTGAQWGGGIALVAATNRSNAQILISEGVSVDEWEFDKEVEGLTFTGEPCVITSYAYAE